jgi:hypothetical protein
LKPGGKSYVHPQYFFVVVVDDVKIGDKRESGLLVFVEDLIVECENPDNDSLSEISYVICTADGKELRGPLSSDSQTIIPGIPPGLFQLELTDNAEEESKQPVRSSLNDVEETQDSSDRYLKQYMNDNKERE